MSDNKRKFRNSGSTSEMSFDKTKRYKYDSAGALVEATTEADTDIVFSGSKSSLRRIADLERNVSILAAKTFTTDGGENEDVGVVEYARKAAKWDNARTLSLTGAVTGSVNIDGSGNVSLATTATSDPTLTISGDASGSATFTNLGNASLTLTIADDSHNHIIGNVDGLQASLDSKSSIGHNHTLDSLSNTTITSNSSGELLMWNGSAWVNATLSEAGIGDGAMTVTAGSGLTGGGQVGTANQTGSTSVTISHGDTSSVSNVNNSGNTFLQDITFDTYGHVQSVASGSVSFTGYSTTSHNHTLDSLSNTTITSNSSGELLMWNGSAWVNATLAEAGIATASALTSEISNRQAGDTSTLSSAQAYTDNAISALVNGADAAYDTLKEIQDAMATDAELSSAIAAITIGNGTMTVSAGSGMSGGGSFTANQTGNSTVTISHADTSTVGSVNNSGNTFIQDLTFDGYGHVTAVGSGSVGGLDNYGSWTLYTDGTSRGGITSGEAVNFVGGSNVSLGYSTTNNTVTINSTNTTYSAGSGLSLSGTTFSHSDTSSVSSVNNSGNTFIQDLTFDGYGHVTAVASGTASFTDTNTTDWRVANSAGTEQFAVSAAEQVRFAGSGATSVSFDSATQTITISSTDTNTVYSHPTYSGDDFSVDTGALTGAVVVSDIDINVTTDTYGHVTDANGVVSTRTLTLADLGYTGATNANYITNTNQLTNGSGYITSSASISGNAATATKTTSSVSGSGAIDLVYASMADNDQFRIRVGGTGSNAGYAEIATADDGTEPIYVRQYTGVFSSLQRTATLLDGSGNTSFPGTVTAPTFSGSLSGNASSASYATTVGINYNNNSNSTYQMLWGSGNYVYGTSGIYCNPYSNTVYATTFNGNATSASYASSAGNADTTDGLHVHSGRNNEANKIVRTDGNGYLQTGYINSSNGDEGNNSSPSRVWGTNGSDSYLRTYLTSALSVNYSNTSGTATYANYVYVEDDNSTNANRYITFVDNSTAGQKRLNEDSGLYYNPSSNNLFVAGEVTAYASDAQLKTNVAAIESPLAKLEAIRGVTYNWNEKGQEFGLGSAEQVGVIAQEVEAVLPQLVTDSAIEGYKTVKYDKLTALLIEAVKELSAEVKTLKAELGKSSL